MLVNVTTLMAQVNITILPVILLPVTGLSCLVFYNRLAALNSVIHSLQRELRSSLIDADHKQLKKNEKDLARALYDEYRVLLQRSHMIRGAIKLCFIALFLFAISGITVIASVFHTAAVFATLALWVFGALSFALALIRGFLELHKPALHTLHYETRLIQGWLESVLKS